MNTYCPECNTRMFTFGGRAVCINVKAHDRIKREKRNKAQRDAARKHMKKVRKQKGQS